MRQVDPDGEGFEHNLQSLRVVDSLEERYPEFDGLNLTFETREGILKHCSRRNAKRLEAAEPGGIARRFLDGGQPGLEAQLCNVADEIAYNAHDIDDGVRSGLLTLDQVQEVPMLGRFVSEVAADYSQLAKRRLLFEVIRRMLSQQIYDVIASTNAALDAHAPSDPDAVRHLPVLVGFSSTFREQALALKQFLRTNLYRHPRVVETTDQAKEIVRALFFAYLGDPTQMSGTRTRPPGDARAVADYVAGMTDRFASKEYERLTGRPSFDAPA
jgi:dGTPase